MGIDGMRIQFTILKPFVSTTTDYAKRMLHKHFVMGTTTTKCVLSKTMPASKLTTALKINMMNFICGCGIPLPHFLAATFLAGVIL